MAENKYCKGYCSPTCVDGTCPNAVAEEYYEYDIECEFVKCSECYFSRGNCDDDCIFRGTSECEVST